jgi:uncharacterized protein with PQ loop repeat
MLIHGYHLGIEDQDVYLAAVHKELNPDLYPVNSVFFTEQMKSSCFIPMVAASIRVSHLPVPWVIFLWQAASIYLVLMGCWQVATFCFAGTAARWCGLALVTVLMTMPIAGTALFLVDTYLHPRALAAGAILMALVACLRKRWIPVLVWLIVAALMHPLMSLFGISLVIFAGIELPSRWRELTPATSFAMLPLGLLSPPTGAWNEATLARRYYFPTMWTWYEWLGLIVPVLLVLWFWRIARRKQMESLEFVSLRVAGFAIFQFVVAALMTIPAATRQLSSLQPMRWLHIFYFLFLLIAGGLAGQFLLKEKRWRWLALFVPLAATMFWVQHDSFRHSSHIDWPWRVPRNAWAQAFAWSDANTPVNAVFATDPKYMALHGEDTYGIRGLTRRSVLAEDQKDPGAATVFPTLAEEWQEQVHAQRGIERFSRVDFHRLNTRYGVSWVVLPALAEVPLDCPYRNEAAQVCRVE